MRIPDLPIAIPPYLPLFLFFFLNDPAPTEISPFPLHAPLPIGRRDKLRDQLLKEIRAPMLFVQGPRDAFGTADEIRATVKKHRLPATLYMIEGGDHSFKVSKSTGVPQQEVYETVMDEVAAWSQSCQNRER